MKNIKLWLDLELRKDIDDYITLIYALETGCELREISIHNPSKNELTLLSATLREFDKNIPIIISGDITTYPLDEDIHSSLLSGISSEHFNDSYFINLDDYLKEKSINNRTFFCGGSLFTLSKFLDRYNENFFDVYIQGGFAGKEIVGEENTLKKFKKRSSVPTWNLNLDLNSTDSVLTKSNAEFHFISKNVCHASFVGIDDLGTSDSKLNSVLTSYFEVNGRKKCMHDLLAFMTIFNKDIVNFKRVELFRDDREIPRWCSVLSNESRKFISYKFDYDLFLKIIKKITS